MPTRIGLRRSRLRLPAAAPPQSLIRSSPVSSLARRAVALLEELQAARVRMISADWCRFTA